MSVSVLDGDDWIVICANGHWWQPFAATGHECGCPPEDEIVVIEAWDEEQQ